MILLTADSSSNVGFGGGLFGSPAQESKQAFGSSGASLFETPLTGYGKM